MVPNLNKLLDSLLHNQLQLVVLESVHFYFPCWLIFDVEPDSSIPVKEVVLDEGMAVFYHQNSIEFIFGDLVFHDEWTWGDHHDAVVVLIDFIPTYLSLSTINQEYPFNSPTINQIPGNRSINTTLTPVSNPRLDIIMDLIILNMRWCLLLDENSLLEVFENIILTDDGMSIMIDLYPSHLIKGDLVSIEDPWVTVLPLYSDPVFKVLRDFVGEDFSVASDVFTTKRTVRPDVDTMLVVLLNYVLFD